MLNIDEVIAHARENYNDIINTTYNQCQDEHRSCDGCATPTCKEIADENLQIAEWLEELKVIKEMDLSIPQHFTKEQSDWIKKYCINRNKEFYNKALDDFAERLKAEYVKHYVDGDPYFDYIDEIAEQLKEQKE